MKSLKIGILTEIINFHSGSRAPLEIARHLAKLGHEVTVYAIDTMLDPKAKASLKKDGVKIIIFKRVNIPYFGKWITSISLFIALKKAPQDIMTFSGTMPFFAAGKLTGKPIVRIYQGTQFDALLENTIPEAKITIWLNLLNIIANIYIYLNDFISFRLSDGIICISKFAKDEGEHLYKKKVDVVIYHGTTPLLKRSAKLKKNRGIVNIISVSRITPYKGFHKIIKAIKNVKTKKKVILTVVGSQPKQNYLTYLQKIGGNKLKIVLDPPDTELAETFKNADIYACADRYLYFGLPICEAAYFNIPTVTLNLAAASEIVEHNKTGYVAKTQSEFSKYLEKLINEPTLCTKMGRAANKRVQHFFSWNKAALKYQKFLVEIAEKY